MPKNTCEEVSLKGSYALVVAGVLLGSYAKGGALYWCLVMMVALAAAAATSSERAMTWARRDALLRHSWACLHPP